MDVEGSLLLSPARLSRVEDVSRAELDRTGRRGQRPRSRRSADARRQHDRTAPADPFGQPAGAVRTRRVACWWTSSACAPSPICAPASRWTARARARCTTRPEVEIRHLSLFPEQGERTDAAATEPDAPVVLPWQNSEDRSERRRRGCGGGLPRLSRGPRRLHPRDAAADRRLTGRDHRPLRGGQGPHRRRRRARAGRGRRRARRDRRRLRAQRRGASRTSSTGCARAAPTPATWRTPTRASRRRAPATIEQLLAALDEQYGGASGWLRAHGWTDDDAAALRAKLLQ